MLLQMHWQYPNGTTEMKAQKELSEADGIIEWAREIEKKFPLAIANKGAQWVFVTQESPLFVGVAEDADTA